MGKQAILCVDDEVILLMSLLQELKDNLGDRFVYESAQNAEQAFAVIKELVEESIEVIVVISDWHMPGMKGDAFLTRVRELYPSIKTIMITGMADTQARERTRKEALVHAILDKPWDKDELIQAVKACWGEINHE